MKDEIISTVYVYSRVKDNNDLWNPNNISRIDQYGKNVLLAQEVNKALPLIASTIYCGFNSNPNIVGVAIVGELTSEEKDLLSTVVYGHKNNICVKFAVYKADGTFIADPANPIQAYLFNSEEQAQNFIVSDGLSGYAIYNSSGVLISDPNDATQPLLFSTEEAAQQYIDNNNMIGATIKIWAFVKGVVEL